MNKNKNSKIMLVLSILLLFLIIGSVSATDETSNEKVSTTTNDGVDTLNTDSASVDEKASTADNLGSSDASNKDSTLESTNNELLSENPVNWTVLENEITGKESVKLNNNYYKYVSGDKNQINLTGIKVLDGNGATIDADNQVDIRPFQSSGNILIKNIHFINIKQTTAPDANYRGGPILFDVGSSNIILYNCTFSQLTTTANSIAGAIGISGGNNVTIKNCKFYDNNYYNSLVIFHPSHSENITIENCQFNNNTASNYNGDLYFAEVYNLTIKKCNFTNENAKHALIAGGNTNSRNVTMSHCNIINTTSTGNLVYFNGQYTNVYDCNITNTTTNSANYLLLVKSFSNVTYCNFDANTYINITNNRTNTTGAKYTRGLRLDGNNITIKYCNISNCVANGNGGGILAGTITNTTIAFCNFKNNFATISGGALNIGGTSNHNHVYNCTFVENGCRANGGAIEFYTSYSILENCTFNSNFITNDHPNGHFASGGAIVLYNLADNVTIRNSIFINNHIEDPLNLQNDPMGYSGSAHNTNNSAGGAIGIAREANLYLNIVGCYFENNSAREGGAVSFNGQYASISDCEFVNNTARLYGGAIYTTALDSTIKDCNFTGNNAPNGKDSYASSKGSIHYEGLYFDEFYIKNDDNAQTSVGTGNGQSSDNPVEWSNDLYTYFKKGSQITLYIVDSLDNFAMRNLNNNYSNVIIKAQSTGSGFKDLDHTVFNIGAGHVTLDGLTFQNITDNVIVNNADGTNIKNCVFTGNNATGNGSCILGQSKGDNLIIDNCTFNGNNATNGGAIYIKNTTNTSQILNCKFFNNHAKEFGGAIYIDEGMYYYIFEPVYKDNTASMDNDASIERALAMLPVIYASFTDYGNGSAENPMNIYLAFTAVAPNGKIIFAKSGDIINYNQPVVREFGKSNVTFIGNNTTFVDVQFYANSYARNTKLYNIIFVNYTQTAIKSESTDNLIQNCKFINCTQGCIIVTGDGSKAVNCTFENNTLDGNGTCIMIDAKHITIENSTFTGNNATGNGGAIYITKDASDINLVNSEFNDNNATLGGAVYNNGALTIKESSSFTGNNATMGGAVYNNATLTITKSDFTGNNATMGGAVYNNATLTINDSHFTTNNATYGGAVFSNAKVTIRGTDFTGNSAVYGGALFLNASDNTLDDLSFNDNSALFGSAIYINQTGTLTLKSTDFTSNRVSDEGEGTVYFAQNNTLTAKDLTFKDNTLGTSNLDIVAADGAILFSKVLYVSPEGNGHGIVSDERTTLSNALKQAVKDSIIYLEHGNYNIDTLKFINQQVTIMGNGSTIRINNKDKSLFNNHLHHIRLCS